MVKFTDIWFLVSVSWHSLKVEKILGRKTHLAHYTYIWYSTQPTSTISSLVFQLVFGPLPSRSWLDWVSRIYLFALPLHSGSIRDYSINDDFSCFTSLNWYLKYDVNINSTHTGFHRHYPRLILHIVFLFTIPWWILLDLYVCLLLQSAPESVFVFQPQI